MIKVNQLFDFLYMFIGIPFLFMMIITSRGFTEIKTLLLMVLSAIAFAEIIICKKGKLPKNIFLYIVLFVLYYMLLLIVGIMNGYQFSLNTDFSLIQYYCITPILVFILSTIFIDNTKRLAYLFKLLMYITLIVVILDVNKLLANSVGILDLDFLNLVMIASDLNGMKLAMRVSNEASLMFLLPFYIVLMFEGNGTKKDKLLYFLIVGVGIIYALLSGRKMLEIVIVFAVIIMVIRKIIFFNKRAIKFIFGLILLLPVLLYALDYIGKILGTDSVLDAAIRTLQIGLASDSSGMQVRKTDTVALIDLWLNSPIWGNGLNAHADVIANGVTFWSYEVVYIALLAQTGVIGIGIFATGVLYITKRLYYFFKLTRDILFLAVMVAFLSFVLCGATNPLVYYIWPWVISLSMTFTSSKYIEEE